MANNPTKPRPVRRAQLGFGLLEILIVVGIIGGLLAYVIGFQNRADSGVSGNQLAQGTTTMVAGIKKRLEPSKTYSALTATWLNSNGLVVEPYTWDGTNIKDPVGNNVAVTGGATTFALTVGGTTNLSQETCTSFVSSMAPNALAINLGTSATVAAGAVSGGSAYKTASSAAPDGSVLTSCATSGNVIAMQFR